MCMDSGDPVIVTIRSWHAPSDMLILAPLSSLNFFTVPPPLPIMLPTSFPCIISLIVSVTLGLSLGPMGCFSSVLIMDGGVYGGSVADGETAVAIATLALGALFVNSGC